MLPSPDKLNNFEGGKFVLSNLAAKRAKQLKEGAAPLVQVESRHYITIALAEIAAGKIKPKMEDITTLTVPSNTDFGEVLNPQTPEFGLLLPALDETETQLVAEEVLEEEELEEMDDLSIDKISDLADGEPTDEDPNAEATVSLSDLAEEDAVAEDDLSATEE